MIITQKIRNKVLEHKRLKEQLADLREREMNLRAEIAAVLNEDQLEGTFKYDLSATQVVRIKQTYYRNIMRDEFSEVVKKLPRKVLEKLIRVKHEINKAYYDELSENHRAIFDECVVEKPGAPTIEIIDV